MKIGKGYFYKKKLTSFDLIRIFIATKEFLPKEIKKSKKNLKDKELEKILKKILKKVVKISEKDLRKTKLDNYFPRYDLYFNSTWKVKEIKLKDCGVWPLMGGLPERFSKGNLIETAKEIMPYIKNREKLDWETHRILYIESILGKAELISEYFPIIALEGNLIRNSKGMKDHLGKSPKKTKYDLEDGSHRAVALAIKGKKKIKVILGKKVYKSPCLYN